MQWNEFSALYCETQDQTMEGLAKALSDVIINFHPKGFLIAECGMMGSSYFGQRVILPYGGGATLPEPPTGHFSPRGLASDQSKVIATMPACCIPSSLLGEEPRRYLCRNCGYEEVGCYDAGPECPKCSELALREIED